MRGALDLLGVLTAAAGLLWGLFTYLNDPAGPLWVPAVMVFGGFLASLTWFALAAILKRLEELQAVVGKPSR